MPGLIGLIFNFIPLEACFTDETILASVWLYIHIMICIIFNA